MAFRDRRVHRTDLSGAGDSRRWHLHYLTANIFEAATGLAAALGGGFYFLDEHSLLDASVGKGLQSLSTVWSILYFAGGLLMLVGLLRANLRMELVGLCFFLPAALTESVAILLIANGKGIGPGLLFGGLALAAFVRAVKVWQLAATTREGDSPR